MLVAILGIGTTEDTFHILGTLPLLIDILKSIVRELAIDCAVPLSIIITGNPIRTRSFTGIKAIK